MSQVPGRSDMVFDRHLRRKSAQATPGFSRTV
jgi:hypothetical protein